MKKPLFLTFITICIMLLASCLFNEPVTDNLKEPSLSFALDSSGYFSNTLSLMVGETASLIGEISQSDNLEKIKVEVVNSQNEIIHTTTISEIDTNSLTLLNYQLLHDDTLFVSVDIISQQGNTVSYTTVLKIIVNPLPTLSIVGDTAIDTRDSITYTAQLSYPVEGTYVWGVDSAFFDDSTSEIKTAFQTSCISTIAVQFIEKNGLFTLNDSLKVIASIETIPGWMVLIPAKNRSFCMGSNGQYAEYDEVPIHEVQFTYDFYMDTVEVTQKKYDDIMKSQYGYPTYTTPNWLNPYGVGDDYPAKKITWCDAILYCNALSKKFNKDTVYSYSDISGIPGNGSLLINIQDNLYASGFRLPTEAEWEFSCRGSSTGETYWGGGSSDLYVWNIDNSGFTSHPVGQKLPNSFNLYDMIGNVAEWCNDRYDSLYYDTTTVVDPIGPTNQIYEKRSFRGGGFASEIDQIRASWRWGFKPEFRDDDLGFRVVLPKIY